MTIWKTDNNDTLLKEAKIKLSRDALKQWSVPQNIKFGAKKQCMRGALCVVGLNKERRSLKHLSND